jgi:hypothetical protein
MARSNRKAELSRRRKRAETIARLRRRYASSRRDERGPIVEKLRRIAPWLSEEILQTKRG